MKIASKMKRLIKKMNKLDARYSAKRGKLSADVMKLQKLCNHTETVGKERSWHGAWCCACGARI